MVWIGIAVGVLVALAVGTAVKRRSTLASSARSEHTVVLSEADRVRRTAPAAPMVGLEAALDGVTDAQGRTLREQLDAGATGVEQLRVDDDTSPILRRALDHVEHATSDEPGFDSWSIEPGTVPRPESGIESGPEQGSGGSHEATPSGD